MKFTTAMLIAITTVGTTLGAVSAASASSDAAWQNFAKDVRTKCLQKTKGMISMATIAVDPTGSEHYGLAVVSGKRLGNSGGISFICVYDKKTKKAEIGSEIEANKLQVGRDQ